jgi:hypothetical protein
MNHADPHQHGSHGTAAPTGQTLFPAAEWEAFRVEDRASAAAIAGLMAGIFTIGLILYSVVAWVVGSS